MEPVPTKPVKTDIFTALGNFCLSLVSKMTLICSSILENISVSIRNLKGISKRDSTVNIPAKRVPRVKTLQESLDELKVEAEQLKKKSQISQSRLDELRAEMLKPAPKGLKQLEDYRLDRDPANGDIQLTINFRDYSPTPDDYDVISKFNKMGFNNIYTRKTVRYTVRSQQEVIDLISKYR